MLSEEPQNPQSAPKPPSKGLRASMEKTIGFIMKNGPDFEKKLIENDKNGMFSFLDPKDSHHEFYLNLLEKARKAKKPEPSQLQTENTEQKKRIVELSFISNMPPMSLRDMKIMRLTAQAVAVNGNDYADSFYRHAEKTGRKNQFAFLRKNHTYHPLYENYVNWYRGLIDFSGVAGSKLERKILDSLQVTEDELLGRSLERAAYEKKNKLKKENQEAEVMARQEHYASINWQDFAYVARVKFDAIDEVSELSAPLTLEEVMSRSLATKNKNLELEKLASRPQKPEELVVEEKDDGNSALNEPMLTLNYGGPKGVSGHKVPEGMKVKAKGESRLKRKLMPAPRKILCPFTGEQILEAEFDSHLRVILRDPRYQEQQENYMRKNFSYASNLTTEQVYENIKNLVRSSRQSEEEAAAQNKRART